MIYYKFDRQTKVLMNWMIAFKPVRGHCCQEPLHVKYRKFEDIKTYINIIFYIVKKKKQTNNSRTKTRKREQLNKTFPVKLENSLHAHKLALHKNITP